MTDETVENGENRVYEVGYLLLPSVPEERLQTEVSKIKALIKEASGALISEEDPAYRTLAYEMSKRLSGAIDRYTEAYFGWIKFEADASKLPELKTKLDQSDTVLRYLLVKTTREDLSRKASEEKGEDGEMTARSADPAELDKSIDALVAE